VFVKEIDRFGFNGVREHLVFNPFEAQIDTGNMMQKLLKQAVSNDILILNQQTVTSFVDKGVAVEVVLNDFSFRSKKVLATNGFANTLTGVAVKPARAQVLITEPIENLDIKGTFIWIGAIILEIGDRILLGGGRNLDFDVENTTEFAQTEIVQNKLEELLKEVILPNQNLKLPIVGVESWVSVYSKNPASFTVWPV
jgi:glycine/D-amino acid oxidase-like deaminating enzyme